MYNYVETELLSIKLWRIRKRHILLIRENLATALCDDIDGWMRPSCGFRPHLARQIIVPGLSLTKMSNYLEIVLRAISAKES